MPFFVRAAGWIAAAAVSTHATAALIGVALLVLAFAGWVVADDDRTRRLARLIRAARRDPRPAPRRPGSRRR